MQTTKAMVGFTRRSDSARQVADLIRSDIVTNRFQGNLPYEWNLVETYMTTRNVIRDALAILQGQNLLRRVPGSGTFTLSPGTSFNVDRKESRVAVSRVPNSGRADPVYAEKTVRGYPDGIYKCINARISGCPETVAARLQISPGTAVMYIEVAISLNHERQRLRSSWVPLDRVTGIQEESLDCFVPDLIARLMGTPTYSKHMLFEAVNADRSTSELLGIPENAAVLMTERINCVDGDVPVEFGFTRHRGDRTLIISNL